MSRVIETMLEQTRREEHKTVMIQLASRLLAKHKISYEEIAELTELSLDEIKALSI